jgi:hypothetical protein
MRALVLAFSLTVVLALAVGGCGPITWMDGTEPGMSKSTVSDTGPDLGTLRHRDRRYDLRKTMATGTSRSNDGFIRDFKDNAPLARSEVGTLDARTQIDAVAVEDLVADVDQP